MLLSNLKEKVGDFLDFGAFSQYLNFNWLWFFIESLNVLWIVVLVDRKLEKIRIWIKKGCHFWISGPRASTSRHPDLQRPQHGQPHPQESLPHLIPPGIPPPTLVLPLPFFIPIPTPIPLLIPVPSDKYYAACAGGTLENLKKELSPNGGLPGGLAGGLPGGGFLSQNPHPQSRPQSRPPSANNVMLLNDIQNEIMSDCSSNNENSSSDQIILDEQRRRRRRALIIDKPSHNAER